MWNAYLLAKYGPGCAVLDLNDVPALNILQKMAREMFRHKRDNLRDIAGYAATAQMLHTGKDSK